MKGGINIAATKFCRYFHVEMSVFYYAFSVFYQTAIAVLIIVLVKYNWDRRKLYALSWRCDGPLAIPFGGNLLSLSGPSKGKVRI